MSIQVDEFKGENKVLTEKIQELIHNMNNLKKAISDKEIENKSIVSNIIELKAQYDKEISETLNPPEAQEENEEEEEENEEENEED